MIMGFHFAGGHTTARHRIPGEKTEKAGRPIWDGPLLKLVPPMGLYATRAGRRGPDLSFTGDGRVYFSSRRPATRTNTGARGKNSCFDMRPSWDSAGG